MPQGWREQYDRMRRWYARLIVSAPVDDCRVDDFYAFFVFCSHLRDWLKQDPTIDKKIGVDAKTLVDGDRWLGMCADIANGSKHLRLIILANQVNPKTAGFTRDTLANHFCEPH
jgi:hypothetical protein